MSVLITQIAKVRNFSDEIKMNRTKRSSHTYGALFFLLGVSVFLFLVRALYTDHPGHGDPSFYVEHAKNISEGNIAGSDYIWMFFIRPEEIERYPFDYWLPGVSLFQSLFVYFGGSLGASAVSSAYLAASVPLVLLAYALMKLSELNSEPVDDTPKKIFLLSAVVFFAITSPSLALETELYSASFILMSLFLIIKSKKNSPKTSLFLGFFFAGLAYCFRGDAMLWLLFAPLVAINLKENIIGQSGKIIPAFAGLCCTIIPLAVLNKIYGGFYLPASGKSMFLSEYKDLFAYAPNSFSDLLLENDLSDLLAVRFFAFLSNLRVMFFDSQIVLFFFVAGLTGLVSRISKKKLFNIDQNWEIYIFVHLITLTLFYSALLPFYQAGFRKGTFVLLTSLLIVNSIYYTLPTINKRYVGAFVVLLIVSVPFAYGIANTKGVVTSSQVPIEKSHCDFLDDTNVTMTRNVWQYSYSCPGRFVQIPSDGENAIRDAISQYNVDRLILEKGWIEKRPPLDDIFYGREIKIGSVDLHLISGHQNSDSKVYGVHPE